MHLLPLLLACAGDPKDGAWEDTSCTRVSWYADQDGDGYGAGEGVETCVAPTGHVAAAGDCDDADAAIRPGATELCDGLDNDCDGQVDPATAADALTCFRDGDGDTFGTAEQFYSSCACNEGYVLDATDCDDSDGAVYPGAAETWYDGVDSDCLGGDDNDADGDGFAWDGLGGEDCDDTDPTLHPDAVDHCGNGIDDNCDGEEATCGLSGMHSEKTADMSVMNDYVANFGYLPVFAGDADGDGIAEFLMGRRYAGSSDHSGDAIARSDFVLLELPQGLDQPDDWDYLDRTSVSEVTVAEFRLSDPFFTRDTLVYIPTSPHMVGNIDLDGDGYLDYVLGSPQGDSDSSSISRIDIQYGPVAGLVEISEEPNIWSPQQGERLGAGIVPMAPVSDKAFEFVVTTHLDAELRPERPVLYLLDQTHFLEGADIEEAPRVFSFDGFKSGRAPRVGDVDGDGVADVLIGSRDPSGEAGSHASANLFLGPIEGELDVLDADLVIDQSVYMTSPKAGYGGGIGQVLLLGPPQDGAAGPGLAISLPASSCDEGDECGMVLLLDWSGPGWVDVKEAARATLIGPSGARAGLPSLQWGGDTDGDGVVELAVQASDSDWPNTLEGNGAVFLVEPPLTGTFLLENSDVIVRHASEHADFLGTATLVGHSLDGDEWDDLLVTNYLQEDALGSDATRQGGFHVYRGGPEGF